MIKKMLTRIAVIAMAALILVGSVLTVSAESSQYVPYESYTYWDNITGADRKIVYNRPMIETEYVLNANTIGVDTITELNDVCTDKDGYVYLLDAGMEGVPAKIIVLDSNYKFYKQIDCVYGDEITAEGEETPKREEISFIGASNIYVHTDKTLYIADTQGRRVLHTDIDGNLLDTFVLPKPEEKNGSLIPSDFDFRPVKVVADSRGYVYILSEGSYYGALLYAPDKSFIGFYGANTVTTNILGALQSLIGRMFPNNERKSNDKRVLPFTFSDIIIDDKDFIYTATDAAEEAQVKKLNPGGGNNILDSDDVNFTDDFKNYTYHADGRGLQQNIAGIAVDENGFIYALDTIYGRVFIYDSQCRMITAFGGGLLTGEQKGNFVKASGIDLNGDRILISDKGNNTLTVFKLNDYGKKVLALTKMTIDGDYVESREGWEEVLKLDKNLQIAYTGIARAYLAEEEYEKAMEMALEGYDRDTYSLAFEYYRNQYISDNFNIMFIGAILIIAVLVAVVIILKKKNVVLIKSPKLKTMLSTPLHPGYGFEDIKDKKMGSVGLSIVVLLVFYVITVAETLLGGFLFTNYDPGTFNSLWVFVQTVGLVALWVVANWLVCTLLQGKGRFNEILIVTSYSLIPIILTRIVWIILSNVLLETEASFLSIITMVGILWAGLMLVIGMVRIHDFGMGRFIGTTLLTVFGMAAIIFLAILVGILFQQLGGFVSTIFVELIM